MSNITLYTALANKPDPLVGHEPDESIYRSIGKPEVGMFEATLPFTGDIPDIVINGQKMEIRNPNDAVKIYEFALARKAHLDNQFTDLTEGLLSAKSRATRLGK